MKIIIENFGPIYKYEFDLEKDFHIIYGKNNIGKSYAISAVYLILKAFKEMKEELDFDSLFVYSNIFNILEQTNTQNIIDEKLENNTSEVDTTTFLTKNIEVLLGKLFIQKLQESFINTFSEIENISNRFLEEPFKVKIILDLVSFFISIKDNQFTFQLKTNAQFLFKKEKEYRYNFFVRKNKKDIHIVTTFRRDKSTTQFYAIYLGKFYQKLLENATKPYEDIFFLPASRSGLYQAMNIFSSILAILSQRRHLFSREKIEIPALSVPMSDYFLHLSTIKTSGNNDVYNDLAKEMEEYILDAEIIFNDDSKKLEYYNKKTNLRLALSETSSMISEMAPVVAYLKYIVNEKTRKQDNENEPKAAKILFIEEPEAHLHPEVQLKLMNIFAKLIQHDVKIVMTTHSNYIFNKTNNLIYSKEMDFNKISNNHFINTEKGSIVSQAEITPTEIGMEDENFVNVTEQLYNERLSLND